MQVKKLLQMKIRRLDQAESTLLQREKELCTLKEAKSLLDQASQQPLSIACVSQMGESHSGQDNSNLQRAEQAEESSAG